MKNYAERPIAAGRGIADVPFDGFPEGKCLVTAAALLSMDRPPIPLCRSMALRRKLFPERDSTSMLAAVTALSDPDDFARELVVAGYRDPQTEHVTHDYELAVAALAEPDTLFGMSPDWVSLTPAEKAALTDEARQMAGDQQILRIASTALIAVAQR